MKIEAIDVLQLRNMPIPTTGKGKNRKKLPVPDHGFSTVLHITASGPKKARHHGLGEVRALPYLTGESPLGAYNFSRRLGRALVGVDIPSGLEGWAAAEASAALIEAKTRDVMGIAEGDPLPLSGDHAAVRFAYDAAVLDIMARAAGKTVSALLGADTTPVRRNTFARSFAKPSSLLTNLMKGNMPNGWLRGSFAKNGATLATVVGAIAAATNGKEEDLEGVWFDLKGRWKSTDAQMMLEGLAGTTPLRGSSLSLILEQPYKSHATAWYKDLFEQLAEDDSSISGRIRVMVEDDAHSVDSLPRIAGLLPHVDLKIVPQKCGSMIGLRNTLAAAREMGFAGKIYLGNAGMNTELNSIMLVTLAQVLDGDVLLSANHKREDDSKIRQAYPQVTMDEIDPCLLTPPQGEGWGTELCQSVLKKRLRKSDFLRGSGVVPDIESLKTLLIMRAFDDSQLDIRQLDLEEEDEEDELLDLTTDEDDADEIGAGDASDDATT